MILATRPAQIMVAGVEGSNFINHTLGSSGSPQHRTIPTSTAMNTTSERWCLDPLSKIPFVVLSFERQKNPWGKAESVGHCYDRIKARNFLSAFNISPKIRCYVTTFGGLLQAEFGALSQATNAFGELGAMFHGDVSSHVRRRFRVGLLIQRNEHMTQESAEPARAAHRH